MSTDNTPKDHDPLRSVAPALLDALIDLERAGTSAYSVIGSDGREITHPAVLRARALIAMITGMQP